MLYSLSLDWVQIQVIVPRKDYEFCSGVYQIKREDYQTRHFKDVFVISHKDEPVATLAANPHSHILDFNCGLLKIHNKFLYNHDFIFWLRQFLKGAQLTFKSISRLDIALDFTDFAYGLKPEKFIKSFLSDKIMKTGKARFKCEGSQDKETTFHYLKFGSETSDITYYLYNKSKEMEEKTLKPWIAESWAQNGYKNELPMWRLEFSLKSSKKNFVCLDGGDTFNMADFNLLEFANFLQLYKMLLKKYFSFVYKGKQSRKDRMKPVTLFTNFTPLPCVIDLSKKKDSTRSSKIFARKLMELNQDLRGADFSLAVFNNELLSLFVVERDLVRWAEQKLPNFQLTDKAARIMNKLRIMESMKEFKE